MLNGLGVNGLEQALHRLESGVYPIRGEKDHQSPYETYEQRLLQWRKWRQSKRGDREFKRRSAINQRKYQSTCPKAHRRAWEDWEMMLLEQTRHLPARVVAFALQRGIRAVQMRRLGVEANRERCRLWRLRRTKQGSRKGTKKIT